LQESSQHILMVQAFVNEWTKVKDWIQTMHDNHSQDFCADKEGGKGQLIKVSPFQRNPGPALFAWESLATLISPERPDIKEDLVLNHLVDSSYSIQSLQGIGCLVEMNWDLKWSNERVDTPKLYYDRYPSAISPQISLWKST